ncbi:MAG: hypothetical protein WCL32_20820 [Planctomycetota bacterium]
MKLESVQELKAEIFGRPKMLVEGAFATSFRAFANKREAIDRALSRVALGVFREGPRKYKLAIRTQRRDLGTLAIVEQMTKKAKNEVEIRYIGHLVKRAGDPTQPEYYHQSRRPLQSGASIGDLRTGFVTAGSLGCFVRDRATRALGFLSNNHVLANENATPLGSKIYQPGTLDSAAQAANVVGKLAGFNKLSASVDNLVDVAWAEMTPGLEASLALGALGDLAGLAELSSLHTGDKVFKIGRTTGQTEGRFTGASSIDNVKVEYHLGVLTFNDQVEFEGVGSRAFSDDGDSGSLIVDESLNAVALLFAGGDVGGSNGRGLTYGNPIHTALDELKLDLA